MVAVKSDTGSESGGDGKDGGLKDGENLDGVVEPVAPKTSKAAESLFPNPEDMG